MPEALRNFPTRRTLARLAEIGVVRSSITCSIDSVHRRGDASASRWIVGSIECPAGQVVCTVLRDGVRATARMRCRERPWCQLWRLLWML